MDLINLEGFIFRLHISIITFLREKISQSILLSRSTVIFVILISYDLYYILIS